MKIISCKEAVQRMFELLESLTVTPEMKKELDNHVQTCRHCCNRFEFEKLLEEKLTDVSQGEKAPKQLVKKVEDLIRRY